MRVSQLMQGKGMYTSRNLATADTAHQAGAVTKTDQVTVRTVRMPNISESTAAECRYQHVRSHIK